MKFTNYGKFIIYKLYTFLAYAAPMLVLFFWKYVDYSTNSRVGFFGILIVAFVIIAFKNTLLKIFKADLMLSVSTLLFVFSILSKFVANELILITGFSMLGSILSRFVAIVGNTYLEYAYIEDEQGRKIKDKSPAIPDKQAWRESYGILFADKGE